MEETCSLMQTPPHNTEFFREKGKLKESARSLVFDIVLLKYCVIWVDSLVLWFEDLKSSTTAAASYHGLLGNKLLQGLA